MYLVSIELSDIPISFLCYPELMFLVAMMGYVFGGFCSFARYL